MKKKPKLDLDRTRETLDRLGLCFASEALSELVTKAVKEETSPLRFLDEILGAELSKREDRRVKTSLRLSSLPQGFTLDRFDFGFQPGIDKKRILTLATGNFIREKETILFQGPPGVGKTHLAVALGVKAVQMGFSVGYYRLDDLLHVMKKDRDMPSRRNKGKKYLKNSLLIIDEVGFEQLDRLEASLFFRLVSWRYEKGSTILTTNKAIKDWPEILAGDEVMTTALLDRLLHHCHVFNIKGRSYRMREIERKFSAQ